MFRSKIRVLFNLNEFASENVCQVLPLIFTPSTRSVLTHVIISQYSSSVSSHSVRVIQEPTEAHTFTLLQELTVYLHFIISDRLSAIITMPIKHLINLLSFLLIHIYYHHSSFCEGIPQNHQEDYTRTLKPSLKRVPLKKRCQATSLYNPATKIHHVPYIKLIFQNPVHFNISCRRPMSHDLRLM